eukprot:scaffold51762_cov37-Tisochrysis_lutea.AAC.2
MVEWSRPMSTRCASDALRQRAHIRTALRTQRAHSACSVDHLIRDTLLLRAMACRQWDVAHLLPLKEDGRLLKHVTDSRN